MKKTKWWWSVIGLGILSVGLAGCGGGGGGSGNVRLVNATLSHPSLDLVSSTNASTVISDVTTGTVSGYASVNSGSPSLQIDDSGSLTALVGTTLSLNGGQHLAVIAYEVDGVVQTAYISEDTTAPAANTAALRIIDLAVGAGNLNIYVLATDSAAPTSALTPTFTLAAPTQATQASATFPLGFIPASYSVWITGANSPADVRLKIDSVALADGQNATVLLTPTTGGTLVDGALLIQQGAYTASPNTNARVRLVAAVSGSATVAAKAGTTSIASIVAPQVGNYVLVPATASTLAVTVNGATITAPTGGLKVGTDSTLLVHGDPDAAVASLLADDNHSSNTNGNVKVRVVNGLSGSTAASVTWSVAAAQLTTPIAVGSASAYYDSSQTTGVDFAVSSTTTGAVIFSQTNTTLQAGQVYSLFLFGDGGSPSKLVLDSAN